ncbi:hypothetical protein SAMN04515663_101383 [Alcanivorax sp. DSM 26293]|jgi:hypothetical protein|uniref:phage head-tail joining protein n=1 Tax=Alcanivorax sp. DSM 26293 TaxID=1798238 RepID=UPI00089F9B4B|nr:hypothetical protein [Alcanivorax sp. DSM 26293]SEF44185.1 hypothetical protein SAMN04515663_101383 [Alcanivorax sp. DSM 26293]
MAYTQSDLDRIEAAIATGTLRITHNGKTTEFRSLNEMIRVRDLIKGELATGSTTPARQHYAPSFDRGYQ